MVISSRTGIRDHLAICFALQVGQVSVSVPVSNAMLCRFRPVYVQARRARFDGGKERIIG